MENEIEEAFKNLNLNSPKNNLEENKNLSFINNSEENDKILNDSIINNKISFNNYENIDDDIMTKKNKIINLIENDNDNTNNDINYKNSNENNLINQKKKEEEDEKQINDSSFNDKNKSNINSNNTESSLELKSLNIIDKPLLKKDFILNNDKIRPNSYIMFYSRNKKKLKAFSIEKRKMFLLSIYSENPQEKNELPKILDNFDYREINGDDCLFFFGSKENKNVYRMEYNDKRRASIEKLNETKYNRRNSCIIYSSYYKCLILVGGSDSPFSTEYLDVMKIKSGWRLFRKKLNNKVFFGKLFILNNTKLFIIYSNKYFNEYECRCEMVDLEEELKLQNIPNEGEYKNNYWTPIKIKSKINVNWKTRIINYNYLGKEKIIIFEGKDAENKNNFNKFNFSILDFNEKENEIIEKREQIYLNTSLPFFYYSNFISIDYLKVDDKDNNINDNNPLNCNYDYNGNLWFFYGDKLRRI